MVSNLILWFLGTPELLVIAVIVLLLFGAKRIPELMRSLGKGVNSFKEGMNEPLESRKEKRDTATKNDTDDISA